MEKKMIFQQVFFYISVTFGLLALLTTGLSLLENEAWWIRIFDFPRLQILGLALISLLLYAFCCHPSGLLHYSFMAALAAAAIYQSFKIFPYTPVAPIAVRESTLAPDSVKSVSLVVVNVLMDNREADRCLQMIRQADPDLILAVETDEWWQQQLASLHPDYPHRVHYPLPNTYGMLLYSRLPLHQSQVKFLVEPDVPSVHTQVELPSGERFTFYGLHPRPPAPQESTSSLPRDAELIIVGKQVAQHAAPTIVAGDLNDVAWSHTSKLFQEISQLLDPRQGRGMYSTFNAKYPLLRWPLDHVFHSDHFRLLELRRLPYIGSDHFPIYVRLSYEPEKKHEQTKPEPEPEDFEDAEEKLDKAREEL
jgi:endonuclease/exonuclease/phosphatase (EEP) superfamily protein YafD